MTMRAMVEEMYREFKKGQSEDSSTSKQDKGTKESLIDDHSEGKGKGKEALCPHFLTALKIKRRKHI